MHLARLERAIGWDAIVTADLDATRAKPRPTLYLEALDELHVDAADAVAFEDSPNGAAAAKAAGIFVVGVPNAVTADLGLEEHADLVVESLADLPPEELLRAPVIYRPERAPRRRSAVMSVYQRHTLSNGLRVLTAPLDHAKSVACYVMLAAGSPVRARVEPRDCPLRRAHVLQGHRAEADGARHRGRGRLGSAASSTRSRRRSTRATTSAVAASSATRRSTSSSTCSATRSSMRRRSIARRA